MPLLKNRIKNRIKNNFDDIELQEDFNPILSFVSEFCELPHAFVSLIGTGGQIIKAEIGFDFLTIPENIQLLNEDVIQHNKIIIVNNGGKEAESKKTIPHPFLLIFLRVSQYARMMILLLERFVLWISKRKNFLPYK